MPAFPTAGAAFARKPLKRHSIPRKPVAARTSFGFGQPNTIVDANLVNSGDDTIQPIREYDSGDEDVLAVRPRTAQSALKSAPRPPPAAPPPRLHDRTLVESKYESYKSSPAVTVESTSVSRSGSASNNDGEKNHAETLATWRPKWLRPIAVGTFAVLFLVFTAALAFMLWYSRQHNGLVETRRNLVYLWRFGPTAVLTLVAVCWARVELQAMKHMPWIAMRRGQSLGREGFALDYTSMLSIVALVQSLQYKHYLVFLVSLVGFALKVQVVLAPGLYSLAAVASRQNVTLELLDSFNVDYLVGQTREWPAYHRAVALNEFDMLSPFGVSTAVAYQRFSRANGSARGTTASPLTAVVDGYFSDVQCLEMESHSVTYTGYRLSSSRPSYTQANVNVTLKFEGCEETFPIYNYGINPVDRNFPNWTTWGTLINNLEPARPCPNLPQQFPQFLYWLGRYAPSASNSSQLYLDQGGAVLCSPRAWISKVRVVDDGVNPKTSILSDEPKTPLAVNPWDILRYGIPYERGSFASDYPETLNWGPLKADQMFWLNKKTFDQYDPRWHNSELLHTSIKNLSSTIGPLLGHYQLRQESAAGTGLGAVLVTTDKLVVNEWVCVTMAGMFAVLTVIVFSVLVRYRRRSAVWHRNPTTILGNMVFFRDHPDFADQVANASLTDRPLAWSRSTFTPLVLRTWARATFTVFVLCLAAGLVYALRRSESSDGIATVSEEGYWHLLWTSFPAIVALGVSAYASSCDWTYRDLAVLACLSTRSCNASELDSSLLDMMGVRAFYHSIRRRIWSVTTAQVLATICGFLATFVAILFTVETAPRQTPLRLGQQTWFGSRPDINKSDSSALDTFVATRTALGSFLIGQDADFTFPNNTYGNLTFPALGGLENLENPDNSTVQLRLPAAKIQPTCSRIPEDRYIIDIKNYTEDDTGNAPVQYFYSMVYLNYTCNNANRTKFSLDTSISNNRQTSIRGRSYVGRVLDSPENYKENARECTDVSLDNYLETDNNYWPMRTETYFWGEFSVKKEAFVWHAMWQCNYTFVQVDTDVTLSNVDGKFVIDPENPPIPDLATSRAWDPPINIITGVGNTPVYPELYTNNSLAGDISPQVMTVVEPYGPLSIEALGDASREAEVLDIITSKYALFQSQLLNVESRLGLYENSRFDKAPTSLPAIDAIVIDKSRRRLKQNALVTYIVLGILGVVLLVNLLALLFGSRGSLFSMDARGLAPDGHGSIESMVGLLRGSNVADMLPSGTEMLTRDELHGQMANVGFRLGWFQRQDGMGNFMIGALGDDDCEYKQSKKEYDKEVERRRRVQHDTFASRAFTFGSKQTKTGL